MSTVEAPPALYEIRRRHSAAQPDLRRMESNGEVVSEQEPRLSILTTKKIDASLHGSEITAARWDMKEWNFDEHAHSDIATLLSYIAGLERELGIESSPVIRPVARPDDGHMADEDGDINADLDEYEEEIEDQDGDVEHQTYVRAILAHMRTINNVDQDALVGSNWAYHHAELSDFDGASCIVHHLYCAPARLVAKLVEQDNRIVRANVDFNR
jgi:hypothetical protein